MSQSLLSPDPIKTPAVSGADPVVAVILPCYKVRGQVLAVLERIPNIVNHIICVDDHCPEKTGEFIEQSGTDARVQVLYHESNKGVGAAVCTGYRAALEVGADICVKLDSDGQMDPSQIPLLIAPIRRGFADYTKGNRFFNVEDVRTMPLHRIFGNIALSFFTKLSSGYWNIFDPTNGYTAIHSSILERIPLDKIHSRYFFESDFLFRLGCLNARVVDIPMPAIYGSEISNLKVSRILLPFLAGNLTNFWKRIIYSYYLRDFSIASIYLVGFVACALVGLTLGIYFWWNGLELGRAATPGQVMFAALPLVFGLQLGLSFISYDIARTPQSPIHPFLPSKRDRGRGN